MERQRMTIRLAVLFLLLGTSMAWSQRQAKRKEPPVSEASHIQAESKVHPRYSDDHKGSHGYILEEEDHRDHPGDGHGEEYADSEEQKTHKEQEEAVGNEESDKTVKDDEYDDHSAKGGFQEFKAGGSSFDKHLKDHKADNKELENVKEHDVGEKFGGEATKEHKLGKNREKSKGHKLHGFKNVYHKEEYGDHKTFHDEFLDTDHQHNYDDHHEHQEKHGGKFSKGYKHEGKNKKYDKGDERREWGKDEYDGHHEGKHEKGGQSSKHRHGSKKHRGHHDANAQRIKNSVHKIKKGSPPPHGHHGPHQAQIQPYVSHYSSHHEHAPSDQYKSHSHEQSPPIQYDDDKEKSSGDNGHYSNHESHHGNHGSHAHDHGGHLNHDHNENYSQHEDDHGSDYQERTAQNHGHKNPVKEYLEGKSFERITHRQEPVAHKQAVSSHFGTQQYRQPVYQESSHLKQPEYVRPEKYSHPFSERSHSPNHRVRYGFQPRNHHHHSHHHQQNHQLQPLPRFPELNHQHRAHDHHHGGHKKHFRPLASHYHQESRPTVHARKIEHDNPKPRNEGHGKISQTHYE